jgi:hypothetical protein
MATLYGSSTAGKTSEGKSVSLADVEARLRDTGYGVGGITRMPGNQSPILDPVTMRRSYVLIQVFDSDPKTTLFPASGFYHLRELSDKTAGLLLQP